MNMTPFIFQQSTFKNEIDTKCIITERYERLQRYNKVINMQNKADHKDIENHIVHTETYIQKIIVKISILNCHTRQQNKFSSL